MFRFIHMLSSRRIHPDPVSILWHQLCGHMANVKSPTDPRTCWNAGSHRGVQFLDKVQFPRKQKRYIFSPQFEIRHDTAFEETIRGCASAPRDTLVWISPELIRGLCQLHEMGFAHSYEAWHEGKLVGGVFGVQLGSMITCDSMFHRMSNASKAAYGQSLLHLQKRGFKVVDTNGVATHQVNYGEEWLPRWKFENLIAECLKDTPSFTDRRPCPKLPWEIRIMLPTLRPARAILRRMPWSKEPTYTPPGEASEIPAENGDAPQANSPPANAEEKPPVAAPGDAAASTINR
jgi:leucyl/phenylalanyl-tRNA--protein transferase